MRLDACEVMVTANPTGSGGRYFIFVRLVTACGIEGIGEVYAATVGPAAQTAVIEDVFARHFEGHDPALMERAFRSAHSSGFSGRPDPTVMGAVSGLEIACWDIVGKALDRPVHALLGGRLHDRIRLYTYLYPDPGEDPAAFYASPARAAEAAAARQAEGWTAVKFDPAGPYTILGGHMPAGEDIARSAAMCRAVRDATGPGVDICFGTHGQLTAAGALRLARAIAPADPLWFEEPCPPDDWPGLARVAAGTDIPVATGERLTTKAEFALALKAGAAILQPALGRAGGLWEAKKIAALAEADGAQIAPHLYAGPVEFAANLHLAATCPNLLICEAIPGGFRDRLVPGLVPEAGHIAPPTGPGLGIAFDADLARATPYTGDRLHLEMQAGPHRYDGAAPFAGG